MLPVRSASLDKMPPELRIEKSCPAFTGQTTCGISTKLYWSDQNHPLLFISPARSASLHKMSARDKKINLFRPSQVKLLVGFQPNSTVLVITIPCCAHRQHVVLHCTKWPPELKIKNQTLQE
jgi:hypothetical protein